MIIKETCRCGAHIELEDKGPSFINVGGLQDEKGRRFVIQQEVDKWRANHKCESGFTFQVRAHDSEYYKGVMLSIKAADEAEALEEAKRLVTRDTYVVLEVKG